MKQRLPDGLTEEKILEIIAHYENQSEDEAVAEDEAAFSGTDLVNVAVPRELLPQVLSLMQDFQTKSAHTKKVKTK